jgi:drug/metabolite transporter (DMT)-like permease
MQSLKNLKNDRANNQAKRLIGYGLAMAGAFLFATKGIFIKLAYGFHIDAITLLTLRLFMATPFFVVIGLITSYRKRHMPALSLKTYLKAGSIGILGYWFASYTDFEGLVYLSAHFERLILFTYPAFVIILGALWFGHALKPWALSAFGISYAGLGLVLLHDLNSQGTDVLIGSLWVMASSIAFALYLLLAKPVIKEMGASLFTSVAMLGAFGATLTHYGLSQSLSHKALFPFFRPEFWSLELFLLCLGLSIGATVLPSYLVNFAMARISSQANAIIGFINPIMVMILSVLILREAIGLIEILGAVFVLFGVGLYTYLDQRPLNKPSVESAL